MNRAPCSVLRKRRIWCLGMTILFTVHGARCTVHGIEMKPVIDAQIMGGQFYYKGTESSLGGNFNLVASPYMKLNDQWSLVPLYSGSYRGAQQVIDLVGGGTLFQDSQSHAVSVKGIRSFENGLKLKAVAGYSAELLRETKDEDWTKGLYDNRRLPLGAEAEWSWAQDEFLRLAYDYYTIRFPNYQSLSSLAAAEGQGRELDAPDVLNTKSHAVTLGSQCSLPGSGLLEGSISRTWRSYSDQHLVDASGALIPERRHDHIEALSLQTTYPLRRQPASKVFATLGFSRTHLYSDQNHYEAATTKFVSNYYAYVTHSVQSQATWLLGQAPWTLQWNGSISRQKYSDRLTQDSVGTYGADPTKVDFASTGFTVSYPITKGFQLRANISYGWNDSNNTYTKVYQYHYDTASYLLGFSYAY